jgi:hypothetical protein
LEELATEDDRLSPQIAFVRLPSEVKARRLAEQAQQMKDFYEQTAEERHEGLADFR